MKAFAIGLAQAFGWLWRLVPFAVRRGLVTGLMLVDSRIGPPDAALKRLFALDDDLERLLNERATAFGEGAHPKHRLTRYHDFFVERVPEGSRVLDVGCGIGAVARSIAEGVPGSRVVGVDLDPAVLERARDGAPDNAVFVQADATEALQDGPFDVIVLSNVLEHLDGRPAFLARLVAGHRPARVLIRVPLFERSWHLPLRRELGLGYFSDPTHRIEHSRGEFREEVEAAGLVVTEELTLWGEIWAACVPAEPRP